MPPTRYAALTAPTATTLALEQSIAAHEKLITSAALETHPDPLVPFTTYLQHLSTACPSDSRSSFLLLERCTRQFLNTERYKNDVRYVRACLTYADRTYTA